MVKIGEAVECGACGHKRRIVSFVGGHDKLLCDLCSEIYMKDSSAVVISADAVRLIANLKSERDKYKEALDRINDIRNSIIAHQTVNFSEHVYPLVKHLDAAGIKGMHYPDALAYYGSVTDRLVATVEKVASLEAERDALKEIVTELHQLVVAEDPVIVGCHCTDNGETEIRCVWCRAGDFVL